MSEQFQKELDDLEAGLIGIVDAQAELLMLCRPFVVNAVAKQTELGLLHGALEDAFLLGRIDIILGAGGHVVMRERGPALPTAGRQMFWKCPTCGTEWHANPPYVGQQCQDCQTWRKPQ